MECGSVEGAVEGAGAGVVATMTIMRFWHMERSNHKVTSLRFAHSERLLTTKCRLQSSKRVTDLPSKHAEAAQLVSRADVVDSFQY